MTQPEAPLQTSPATATETPGAAVAGGKQDVKMDLMRLSTVEELLQHLDTVVAAHERGDRTSKEFEPFWARSSDSGY